MIKTSELQNAKYAFIQVAKGGFGFINSRSMAGWELVQFRKLEGDVFEGCCLNYSLFVHYC